MALENLNVGTSANSNDGDTLRAAFIKTRKMFAEVYGETYSEQTPVASNVAFEVDAERIKTTNDPASGLDGYVMTYDHATGGFTFEEYFNGDITRVQGGSGLSGDTQSGDATINIDLNDLTEAVLDVANDDIAFVDTSDSNTTRKESIADLVSGVAGSGLTAVSGVLSVDAIGTDDIANDAVTPSKLDQFDDSLTAATSGHILVSNGTDFIHTAMSGDATIASGGALTIGNDKITYAKLGAEFTTKAAIPSDYDVDFATATIFTDTMDAATIAYDIENPSVGDVKTLVLSGDGTDRTISFTMSGSTDTDANIFKKMKGSDDFVFTSGALNLVQMIVVDDTSNGEEIWYSNSVVAS